MIRPCNFTAPNGEQSNLATFLIEKYGPERALLVWEKLYNPDTLERVFDWQTNDEFNTSDGELTPSVAIYLYNTVLEGGSFDTSVASGLINIPEITKTLSTALSITEKSIDLDLHYSEQPAKVLSGQRTILLRDKNDPELEIGEEVLAYIEGKAFIIRSEGKQTAAQMGGEEAAVRFLGYEDLSQLNEKSTDHKWVSDGKARQVYTVRPLYTVDDITREYNIETVNRTSIPLDPEEVHTSMKAMFAEIINPDGTATGEFFNGVQQKAGVDALVGDLYTQLRTGLSNGDNLTARSVIAALNKTRARMQFLIKGLNGIVAGEPIKNFPWNNLSPENAGPKVKGLVQVFYAFDQLAGFALDRMNDYGFQVKAQIRTNIQEYLKQSITISGLDNNVENIEVPDDVITGEEGKGLKDWSDDTFQLDPKDTASNHLKFFLANIEESEFGEEIAPRRINMAFTNSKVNTGIKENRLSYTLRSPEQVNKISLGAANRGSVVIDGEVYIIKLATVLNSNPELAKWSDYLSDEGLYPEIGISDFGEF
jgi:hypothetical protein